MKTDFLKSPLSAFAYAVRPYRTKFFLLLALIVVGNIFGYAMPYFLRIIVDTITATAHGLTFSDVSFPFLALAGCLVLEEVTFRTGHILETNMAPDMFARITNALYESLIKRPASYFENRFSGDLGRRIEQVSSAVMFFQEEPWTMAWIVLSLVMAAVNLATTHVYVLLTFLAWVVLFVATSIPLVRWHHAASEKSALLSAELSGGIIDSLANNQLVHSFGGVPFELEHAARSVSALRAADRKMRWAFVINKMQCGIAVILLGVSLVYVCISLFIRGEFTLGEFTLVGAVIPSLTGVIWTFGEVVVNISRRHAEFKDALKSLREHREHIAGGSVTVHRYPSYEVAFRNISFQYPATSAPVFDGFSLTIRPGEKIGIVGSSGAGKSTLVKLLLRQHEFSAGDISISQIPIRDFSLDAFHRLISYVPQDTSLFHRSLYENVRYARPDASDKEVFAASRRARADDFIRSFPNGYDTKVGERGVKLSGGQRQRIALARAILKDAPILILDEATSSLDTESETAIQDALTELFDGRTVIAIAHRLSTLRAMDRIVVLEKGTVIEDGSPRDLLGRDGGIFKRMWDSQKNGFIE